MEQRIVIGDGTDDEFNKYDLLSVATITEIDIVGTELTVDQLIFTVEYPYSEDSVEIVDLLAPSDYDATISSDNYAMATSRVLVNPKSLAYGMVVRYYRGGKLIAKMYVKSVERMSKNIYKINAVSAIGLLDTQKHYGGIYRGESFSNVVSDIIDGAVPFGMDSDVQDLKVYGWLPYDTKRANLHQLLFSNGVMCDKSTYDGDLHFRFISNAESKNIPKDRIYYGGNVNYPSFASAVDVTEHSFFALPTDEEVTVYDNTDGSEQANNTLVVFRDAPLHSLYATGNLSFSAIGVNYAVISGVGKLTGKKYTHSTRIVRRVADNADGQRENVATVSDAYLVNVTNSENVAKRVLAYYNSRKIVTASIVEDGEKCGDLITGFDPYNEPISGFISSMRSEISGIVKSECEIITDYIPTGQGSNYSKYVVLTGSGNWEIPEEVFKREEPTIFANIIGGGHGGKSGENGEGGFGNFISVGKAGKGGKGGAAGQAGNILSIEIDCTGETAFPYSCGKGGASGKAGTDTQFSGYSSASGAASIYGVQNIFTGDIYAIPGVDGVDGGDGNPNGSSVSFEGRTWNPGNQGTLSVTVASGRTVYAYGGHGGGAAVGSNGPTGENGIAISDGAAIGGTGGSGANGRAGADGASYGSGGSGGHGGGGGGEGGSARGYDETMQIQGKSGKGGTGGIGGKGGDGAIIIYY